MFKHHVLHKALDYMKDLIGYRTNYPSYLEAKIFEAMFMRNLYAVVQQQLYLGVQVHLDQKHFYARAL